MMTTNEPEFELVYQTYRKALLKADQVDVGQWHSQDVSGNPLLITREIPWVSFNLHVPLLISELQQDIQPNMPWAEEHFQERVSGEPVNPPPSHIRWPWAHAQHQDEGEQFSHTYPERMWPRFANEGGKHNDSRRMVAVPHNGIRFEYGDLNDVIELLIHEPYTRQAYLPIFFPEDTGGSHRLGERIPCSMGYQFMVRKNTFDVPTMDCMYVMRSCDFVRHFRDDIYMAARLLQWVAIHTNVQRGKLRVHIASLHIMEGDKYKLQKEEDNG